MKSRKSSITFLILSVVLFAGPVFCDELRIDKPAYPEKVTPTVKVPVKEGLSEFLVKAESPFPTEVNDEAQGREIAQNAALVWGRNRIMEHILTKKAHSGKTLETAQIPSLELQKQLRDYVQTARPVDIQFEKKMCHLTVVLPKAPLKRILRKN